MKHFSNSNWALRPRTKSSRQSSSFRKLLFIFSAAVFIGITGSLAVLLVGLALAVTTYSIWTGRSTDKILNKLTSALGGHQKVLPLIGISLGVSLLANGTPAYALFSGAKDAAESGIGEYIGADQAISLIDTIIFGMWALAAVGGIAVIAGGALQNIMVLVGGITLFFGMAVLIGVLEFSDRLLFST